MSKAIDLENGLPAIKTWVEGLTPTKTSDLTNDSGFITSAGVPSASSATPAMDGTGAAGSSSAYARGDHVHPKDTSKLDKSGGTMTGALTLSGAPTANLHAATKKYVDDALSGLGTVLNYKGSVATYANLPANPSAGDVYNVEAAYGDYPAGTNWAYSGTAWDALGGAFTITFATAAEVQAVLNA